MSTKTTVEVTPTEYNGAPARGVERAPAVEVVHNSETGRTEPVVQGGGQRPSRMQVIERAKAKAKAAPAAAAAAPADDDEAVGSGPAGEEPAAATPAEAAPETPVAEPAARAADGEPAAEPTPEPEPAADAKPDATDLDRATARIEAYERERTERQAADLQALIDDPTKALRGHVASLLGLPADHEAVNETIDHLKEELTWGQIPIQDLPEEKKAQLEMARWRREQRLQTHRRKADQEQRNRHGVEERARDQAERSYRTLREKHPTLAVMAELDGRSVGDVVTATLVRAAQAGVIKPDAGDEAAFQEAIRLADSHATQRAKNILTRLAHLATAPAPIKAGASSKPTAPAQQTRSTAPQNQPRALPASKAGAAPSRPAEPSTNQPKRKVVDASAYEDPTDRRLDVLKRHARRP